MAVAYDTASATTAFSNVSSVPTWSHTASGSDRYVRVSVGWAKLGTTTASATYGGNAMASVGNVTNAAGYNSAVTGKAEIFRYIAPSTSSQTVAVTFSAGGNFGAAGSVSYTGVDQTTPDGTPVTATGTGTSASVTVTDATTGDMVSDAISADEGSGALTGSQTERIDNSGGGGYRGAAQDAAGAASVVMSWTIAVSRGYAQVAAAIFQASGGGATNLTLQDESHAHTADNLALTLSTTLAIDNASHAHTSESPAPTTDTTLAVAAAAHAHTAENVTLSTTGSATLVAQDAAHAHTSEAIALTADSTLAVASASHAHTADNVTLSDAPLLAAQDAGHAHVSATPTLSLASWLEVADSAHAHLSDGIALTPVGTDAVISLGGRRRKRDWRSFDVMPHWTPPDADGDMSDGEPVPPEEDAEPVKVRSALSMGLDGSGDAPVEPASAVVEVVPEPEAKPLTLADVITRDDLTHDELVQAIKLLARAQSGGLVRSTPRLTLRRVS